MSELRDAVKALREKAAKVSGTFHERLERAADRMEARAEKEEAEVSKGGANQDRDSSGKWSSGGSVNDKYEKVPGGKGGPNTKAEAAQNAVAIHDTRAEAHSVMQDRLEDARGKPSAASEKHGDATVAHDKASAMYQRAANHYDNGRPARGDKALAVAREYGRSADDASREAGKTK